MEQVTVFFVNGSAVQGHYVRIEVTANSLDHFESLRL